MRAIRFPRALLPVSVVISRLLTFGFELAVLAVVALRTGEGISRRWLALPARARRALRAQPRRRVHRRPAQRRFRDVQQIIPFLFRLLIYLSGVMFPLESRSSPATERAVGRSRTSSGSTRWSPIIDMYRWVFLGNPVSPRPTWRTRSLRRPRCSSFGFWFFRAAESRYGRA